MFIATELNYCQCFTCASRTGRARSWRCLPRRLASMATPRSTWLLWTFSQVRDIYVGGKLEAKLSFKGRSWKISAPRRTTWRCRTWSGRIISWSGSMTTSSPSWTILEIWGSHQTLKLQKKMLMQGGLEMPRGCSRRGDQECSWKGPGYNGKISNCSETRSVPIWRT